MEEWKLRKNEWCMRKERRLTSTRKKEGWKSTTRRARHATHDGPAAIINTNAIPSATKERLLDTSLKNNTPHICATIPGPVVIKGNATAKDSAVFATNHDICPKDHMTPDAKAGSVSSDDTQGALRLTMLYDNIITVDIIRMPLKWLKT